MIYRNKNTNLQVSLQVINQRMKLLQTTNTKQFTLYTTLPDYITFMHNNMTLVLRLLMWQIEKQEQVSMLCKKDELLSCNNCFTTAMYTAKQSDKTETYKVKQLYD